MSTPAQALADELAGDIADSSVSVNNFRARLLHILAHADPQDVEELRAAFNKSCWPEACDNLEDATTHGKVQCLLEAGFCAGAALKVLCRMETYQSEDRGKYMNLIKLVMSFRPRWGDWYVARRRASKHDDAYLVSYLNSHEPCPLCAKPESCRPRDVTDWIECERPHPRTDTQWNRTCCVNLEHLSASDLQAKKFVCKACCDLDGLPFPSGPVPAQLNSQDFNSDAYIKQVKGEKEDGSDATQEETGEACDDVSSDEEDLNSEEEEEEEEDEEDEDEEDCVESEPDEEDKKFNVNDKNEGSDSEASYGCSSSEGEDASDDASSVGPEDQEIVASSQDQTKIGTLRGGKRFRETTVRPSTPEATIVNQEEDSTEFNPCLDDEDANLEGALSTHSEEEQETVKEPAFKRRRAARTVRFSPEQENLVKAFVFERCRLLPVANPTNGTVRTRGGALFDAFKDWCQDAADRSTPAVSMVCFMEILKHQGVTKHSSWHYGIELK